MARTTGSILLPLDGSVASQAALDPARRMAEIFAVPLQVLHVAPGPVPERALASRLGLSDDEITAAQVEEMLDTPAPVISRVARDTTPRWSS